MALSTQPVKGARDFYPEDQRLQKYLFGVMRSVCERFGYEEYDAPILEPTELYLSKGNEEIINEQTYTFKDRGDRSVTLRTEMTPSVSRMVAARRQEAPYPLRWYSIPQCWRYERMQRGRGREFYQLNVDIFGVAGMEADIEMIQMADAILKAFGATPDMYEIRVNSRNFIKQRALLAGLKDPNLTPNELLRVLDTWSKDEAKARQKIEAMFAKPEVIFGLMSYKNEDENESMFVDDLKKVLETLRKLGVSSVKYDATIARGFDYYTDIVFEVFDTDPENNRSMFGGGRYDDLLSMFGAESLPSVGFGMGDITLKNFLETHGLLPKLQSETELYVILVGDDLFEAAQKPVQQLREMGLRVAVDTTGRKADKQIKSAVKKDIRCALFIGQKELDSGQYTLKDLQAGTEKTYGLEQIVSAVKDFTKA